MGFDPVSRARLKLLRPVAARLAAPRAVRGVTCSVRVRKADPQSVGRVKLFVYLPSWFIFQSISRRCRHATAARRIPASPRLSGGPVTGWGCAPIGVAVMQALLRRRHGSQGGQTSLLRVRSTTAVRAAVSDGSCGLPAGAQAEHSRTVTAPPRHVFLGTKRYTTPPMTRLQPRISCFLFPRPCYTERWYGARTACCRLLGLTGGIIILTDTRLPSSPRCDVRGAGAARSARVRATRRDGGCSP